MYSLKHLTCPCPGIGPFVLIYKLFFLISNKADTNPVLLRRIVGKIKWGHGSWKALKNIKFFVI